MERLPQFQNLEIVQKNVGGGHRYFIEGFPCGTCYKCKKNQKCIGLPSVTSFSGQWGGGGLYPAGYRHALDTVFDAYTDKAKDEVQETSWFSDFIRGGAGDGAIIKYRQEVEEIPTPGNVARDFGIGVHASLESVLRGDE